MDKKRICVITGFLAMTLAAVGFGVLSGNLYLKVRQLQGRPVHFFAEKPKSVLPPSAPVLPPPQTLSQDLVKEMVDKEFAPKQIAINGFNYDQQGTVTITFNTELEMDVIRSYVECSVKPEGGISYSQEQFWGHDGKEWTTLYRLKLNGDFPYATNISIIVKSGLPAKNGTTLGETKTYSLVRPDQSPRVRYADQGRYLPPGGVNGIMVESVNVKEINFRAAKLPPQNVVQMLARECWQYDWGYAQADAFDRTKEIADIPYDWTVPVACVSNKAVRTLVRIGDENGFATNGIYAVWLSTDKYRPTNERLGKGRLICRTDLGLAVKQLEKTDEMLVWVTSLTRGSVVPDAEVKVYSSANILVMQGKTGSDGLARCSRVKAGNPFAVIVTSAKGDDMSFVALNYGNEVVPELNEQQYGYNDGVRCFQWTERGIYRHNEKIFVHGILHDENGLAVKPMPLILELHNSYGLAVQRATVMSDEFGAYCHEGFSASDEQPSGLWKITVRNAAISTENLAETYVKVEEFVPPQVRVRTAIAENSTCDNIKVDLGAEHLFGGAASGLRAEATFAFVDAGVSFEKWSDYVFGDSTRFLKEGTLRNVKGCALDEKGEITVTNSLPAEAGLPGAAVRVTVSGTVFEQGGRPATKRDSKIIHYYPEYIGLGVGERVSADKGKVKMVVVNPDGSACNKTIEAKLSLVRIERIWGYRIGSDGWARWTSDEVRNSMVRDLPVTLKDGVVELELPIVVGNADYELVVEVPASKHRARRRFHIRAADGKEVADEEGASTAANMKVATERKFYRIGETPVLEVTAPFAGQALFCVTRGGSEEVFVRELKKGVNKIVLPLITEERHAPNLVVTVYETQKALGLPSRQSASAVGAAVVKVRPLQRELNVKISAEVETQERGSILTAKVSAASEKAIGARAVVTVVDEGINMLTNEKLPDPLGCFSYPFVNNLGFYEICERLLPLYDEAVGIGGVKTGGGGMGEMLGKVSPVPSRRFRPLALWKKDVVLDANGNAEVKFDLPVFVGEVRVTCVAYNDKATGSGSAQCKVTPKLVMQPDAPRFVAPGDEFEAVATMSNRSGADAKGVCRVTFGNGEPIVKEFELKDGKSVTLRIPITAPAFIGELSIQFSCEGAGEKHEDEILMPVRPATAMRETAGVDLIGKGDVKSYNVKESDTYASCAIRTFTPRKGEAAKLVGALEYLADYPYGCLEQTVSRIFPLISAGGVLNTISVNSENYKDRATYVKAGVARVASMIRSNDFTMWPDCDYEPWDREVSVYAAHFLVAAAKGGYDVPQELKDRAVGFAMRWCHSGPTNAQVYACQVLAIAGSPEKDRMLNFYDVRSKISFEARARLAAAFAEIGDLKRAKELLRGCVLPGSVKEASLALLARLAVDPTDAAIEKLVLWIEKHRDGARYDWGTTGDNALALMALGERYRRMGATPAEPWFAFSEGDRMPGAAVSNGVVTVIRGGAKVKAVNASDGPAYLSWRRLELPKVTAVREEANGICIARRFIDVKGQPVDMKNLKCGDLLIAELSVWNDKEDATYNDLVIQDLYPAAFEPVHGDIRLDGYSFLRPIDWVMRSDARDDRMLVFSKRFSVKKGVPVKFWHKMRVVNPGTFVSPGVMVEAMYAPEIHAQTAPHKLVIKE